MVGADAKAANDDQVLGLGEDARSELGLGADTEDIDIPGGEISAKSSVRSRTLPYFLNELVFR